MNTQPLSSGVVHNLPSDLQQALLKNDTSRLAWEDITPLARNEWICLVESAKQTETRKRRVQRTIAQLSSGKRRPCCWAGCPHREKIRH